MNHDELTTEQKMKVLDLTADGMGKDEAIAMVLGGLETSTNDDTTTDIDGGDPATAADQECMPVETP